MKYWAKYLSFVTQRKCVHTLTLENSVTFSRNPETAGLLVYLQLRHQSVCVCVCVCVRAHVYLHTFKQNFVILRQIPWISLTAPKPCHYDCYRHYPWFPYSVYKIAENELKAEKVKAVCNSRLDRLAFGIRSEGKGSGIYILSSLETQILS